MNVIASEISYSKKSIIDPLMVRSTEDHSRFLNNAQTFVIFFVLVSLTQGSEFQENEHSKYNFPSRFYIFVVWPIGVME